MVKRFFYYSVLFGLLAGCATAPAPSPTIPAIPQVGVSDYAYPLMESMARSFMQENGPLPFDLVPGIRWPQADARQLGSIALYLDFPPVPEGWFATPVGWEGIALVVHPEVPTRSLSRQALADIYSGRASDWSEFGRGQGPIQPLIPPRGEAFRKVFLDYILPAGNVTTLARLAPTPMEALQLTAELEGAIAIVPASLDLENAQVGIVRVEGTLPEQRAIEQGSYPLRSQIVASAPEEPSGALRDWLIWLQGREAAGRP